MFTELLPLFPDAEQSVRGILNDNPLMELDIWIPSRSLAIEYHGLFWHSMAIPSGINRDRDFRKYSACKQQGIRLIQVYNDDWLGRKDIFLDFFQRIANPKYGHRLYSVRPCQISSKEAQAFLDRSHYLSGSRVLGSFCVALKDKQDRIVAVSVFRRHLETWEWVRHAVKLGTRLWHPAEACLDFFVDQAGPKRVKTFSDNRLHTGNMYSKLSFQHDGLVKQSYEYTNGKVRRHKIGFRVPAGIDEEATAAAGGWYRVYDSGLTRWVLDL